MKTPYTYTILRYVHDTATGEFINVGVALLAPEERYLGAMCRETYARLTKTFPGMNGEEFKSLMRFIQARFEELGDQLQNDFPFEAAPGSVLEAARSILPSDDSSLQWSPAGSGLSPNPVVTLENIFQRMVVRYDERPPQERRSDDEVWSKFRRDLESRRLLKHLAPKKITAPGEDFQFDYAWKNGVWHCAQPISLDLTRAENIREKAHRWLGQMTSLRTAVDEFKVYLLLGEPQRDDLKPAFEDAVTILRKMPVENEIYREDRAAEFSERLADEIESHTNQSASQGGDEPV